MQINYEKGFKLTKENFKTLYKSAKQANINGFFGLACSLNILACEELIKTFFIHIKRLNPDMNIENFEKVFKDHKTKHLELKSFINSSFKGVESLEFTILEGKEDFLKTIPKERLKEFKKEYKDIERVNKRTGVIRKFEITIDDIFLWLETANVDKNRGLYVGFENNGNWTSPKEIQKVKFKKEKEYTELLYLHLKNSIDITNFMAELKLRKLRDN